MNFKLNVDNQFAYEILIPEGAGSTVIEPGQSGFTQIVENSIISIPGMGPILILDVSSQTIWDFPVKGKYGVLIRYQGTEAYYRYDTAGELTMTFSFAGDFVLSTNSGDLIEIKLPGIYVDASMPGK
jgi:hypothetical protein